MSDKQICRIIATELQNYCSSIISCIFILIKKLQFSYSEVLRIKKDLLSGYAWYSVNSSLLVKVINYEMNIKFLSTVDADTRLMVSYNMY